MVYNYSQILESFIQYLYAGNAKKSTIKNYCSDVRYFFGWFQSYFQKSYLMKSSNSLNDGFFLNPSYKTYISIFDTYNAFLTDGPNSNTKRRRLYSLRKFVSFCLYKQLIYSEFNSHLNTYFEQNLLLAKNSLVITNKSQTLNNRINI